MLPSSLSSAPPRAVTTSHYTSPPPSVLLAKICNHTTRRPSARHLRHKRRASSDAAKRSRPQTPTRLPPQRTRAAATQLSGGNHERGTMCVSMHRQARPRARAMAGPPTRRGCGATRSWRAALWMRAARAAGPLELLG